MISPIYPAGVLLYLIMAIGLIGNSIVLFVLIRLTKSWCTSTIYLVNLAAADTLFLLSTPFIAQTILNDNKWIFGSSMCSFTYYWATFTMYAGVYFVTGMGIERWMAVVHPFSLAKYRTCRKTVIVCASIWCSAALLALPDHFYIQILPESYHNYTSNDTVYIMSCDFYVPESNPNGLQILGAINFVKFVMGFLLPLTTLCVLYHEIVKAVRKNLISGKVSKSKVTYMASCIVISFFVLWLPEKACCFVFAILFWSGNTSILFGDEIKIIYSYAFCLAWIHSCFNPMAYGFLTTRFREKATVAFARRSSNAASLHISSKYPTN
ncbi:somatostatin receptor type 2-like [Clavelina lepadiformis]|uniref:somatostatin receptor type 2-like n=1 Tax=Clavelina lepadiformis TaxID=159417 RepID=UPI004041F3D2